ncbi:MAG TPA: hypothetical protein VFA71_14235 [Terriglobales bacterium]|nr:hypothetical protein [Terriglobales bacterium]
MKHIAKLFRNGRSQAVRLPLEFRFQGKEVFIRRDPSTGDVIFSQRPNSWESFFELTREIGVPKDFLSNRGEGRYPSLKSYAEFHEE